MTIRAAIPANIRWLAAGDVSGASCFVAALGGIALARRSRPSPPPQATPHEHPSPAVPGTALPAEDPVW